MIYTDSTVKKKFNTISPGSSLLSFAMVLMVCSIFFSNSASAQCTFPAWQYGANYVNGLSIVTNGGRNYRCDYFTCNIYSPPQNFVWTDLGPCCTAGSVNAGGALSSICPGGTSGAMGGSIVGGASGGTWSGGSGSWSNPNSPGGAQYTASAGESGNITLTLAATGRPTLD